MFKKIQSEKFQKKDSCKPIFTGFFLAVIPFFVFMSLFLSFSVQAADMTSSSFIIKDPIIGTGGGYQSSTSFNLFSSGNILGSMGGATSASFKANYGFLYFEDAIPQSITFDIDTAADFSNGESSTPYAVGLGILSTALVAKSDTSSVSMIVLEAESSHDLVVTVNNSNGSNGLTSTSVPGDNINSTTGTMSAGTENYGLCVATSGLSGFSRSTGYSSDTCALSSSTNGVRALSITPSSIVDSGGTALVGGHAEVVVNASISSVTSSHIDYTDTLTFIATGTY